MLSRALLQVRYGATRCRSVSRPLRGQRSVCYCHQVSFSASNLLGSHPELGGHSFRLAVAITAPDPLTS
jgi:hypothetical protein